MRVGSRHHVEKLEPPDSRPWWAMAMGLQEPVAVEVCIFSLNTRIQCQKRVQHFTKWLALDPPLVAEYTGTAVG